MWSSFQYNDNDKIDVATHSYNGEIRVAMMDESLVHLTIDETKNLIAKLEGAILKTESPS